MGVSKNRGTPKWMVYNGKPYFLMGDLVVPLFLETPICQYTPYTACSLPLKQPRVSFSPTPWPP